MTSSATSPRPAARSPWLSGKIVVGIDGSVESIDALRHAEQLAMVGGGVLHAVIAWQPPNIYGPAFASLEWDPQEDAQNAIDSAVAAVFGDDVPESLVVSVVEGGSARALLDVSHDADLLVVGSRGHGGFAGLLLGSVSSACAEHAKCPVLVIHERKA